ncbi:regulatory protein RecX [Vallitalea okinawensis]|uniref:regulatory protein RecX n=1 Tax=Vallitalea okinawensis TaxID=2078660 RepID=UPI000CFDBC04|nr:regulatory protein RecX [Vallitalea okinawensis]
MIVTQIIPLSKNNYLVYFLDWEELLLSKTEISQYKIAEGIDMRMELYQHLTNEVLIPKARNKAFNYLSYRNRSEKEMRNYLKDQGFNCTVLEFTITFLSRYNYIDDHEFAKSFIESKERSKPYGEKGLRYLLFQKGISNEIIETVLSERNDSAEIENCYKLLLKRGNSKAIPFEKKAKHIGYLQRRGFSYSTINEAFKLYDIHINDVL